MKLHIGCGNNVKEGYVNIDKFVKNASIENYDILKLPIDENSVDEVLAEHVVEHLTFQEEREFFYEMYRVLKTGGKLKLEVPDIEWVLSTFLEANDDFKDFYQVGAVDHYFGNGMAIDNRWSLLTTAIWGNQNGEGQFHKNGYTVDKLKAIAHILNFKSFMATTDFKKGTQVIIATLTK
jgi:predicted SAM-dependent methyltransferase